MCNHISDLPPELRLMVLDRVSRSTLKIICLVNKFWRNLAVPILWGTFVSDLLNNYPRNLDMVLTHRPGSVFTLMRNLHIKKSVSIGQDAFNLKFLQLIMTIAPHTLAEVTVTGAIDRETLGLLIMRQRNLLELSVPMIKDQAPPNHDYVNGNLRSLVKLSMFPNADQAGYEAWLPNMPMLHTLIVSSKRPKQVSLFVPWAITPKMQRLKSLHLHNMTLQPRSGRIDAWTDMYGLYELTIKDCKGMVGFLTDLIVPQSNEKHRLKSIAISETTDTTDWMTNLDNLVHKVEGLQHLYLSSSRQEQTDLAALAIQKHSLTTYLLDPINDWAQFPRADIEEDFPGTLKSCPLIEQLGTSLTHIDFDDWGYTEPWLSDYTIKTSATKTIVQSLSAIALFPSLRVLRLTQAPITLTNPPNTDPRIGPYRERQWRYHQFAEQIMQYLVAAGSNIQLLAFSPTRSHADEVVLEDGNGHYWPHYYYLRSVTKDELPGGRTSVQVRAVPVKKHNIPNYMLWPKVLDDP